MYYPDPSLSFIKIHEMNDRATPEMFTLYKNSLLLHKLYHVSYGKLVTYMNDGTSLRSVRQIRRTEYPEYNLGNTRTSQINNLFGFTCEAS